MRNDPYPHVSGGKLGHVPTTILRWLRLGLLLSPTLFALVYYGFIAADRYIAEAQFIIRTASKPLSTSGLSAFLQMAGLGRAQDDVYSVQAFLNSRDSARILRDELQIDRMYDVPEADMLARFPSIFYGRTIEELHRYLGWMITTRYSQTTGITTLRVEAFRAGDAKRIADTLLAHSEQLVNRMNARIRLDVERTSEQELQRAEERLVDAQIALTKFRNDEVMIDPLSSTVIMTEVVSGLTAELTRLQTQFREARATAPQGPLIVSARNRISAVESQIAAERLRFIKEGGGVAEKVAIYERLVLDLEFSKKLLETATRSLEGARNESRRQQLYLERIVEPIASDYPLAPERLRVIATVFGFNLIALLVCWLIFAGINERLDEHPND